MSRKKQNIPPYYKRLPGENFFLYLSRLLKSIRAMYPHARKHGIRYYFDTEFRRNISYHRKQKLRTKREGKLHNSQIKKKTKILLSKRDGSKCNHCQVDFSLNDLTIDHVIRLVKNGSNKLDNLQLLCAACHQVKSAEENREDAQSNSRPLWKM